MCDVNESTIRASAARNHARGTLYFKQADFENAVQFYSKASKLIKILDPASYVTCQSNMAQALLNLNDAGAIACATNALLVDPRPYSAGDVQVPEWGDIRMPKRILCWQSKQILIISKYCLSLIG